MVNRDSKGDIDSEGKDLFLFLFFLFGDFHFIMI